MPASPPNSNRAGASRPRESGHPDLSDPKNFLDRIDPARDCAAIIRTTREQLKAASFLDRRAGFSSDPFAVPLDVLQDWPVLRPEPTRLLVHVGFCASTHLSRLIECGDEAMVLREPQALTDLATWTSAAARQGARADIAALLEPALVLLSRRWRPDLPVVIKPSNWANVLLPLLDPSATRMVAVVCSRGEFLRALLRGGPERLGYAGRAALHFSSDGIDSARLVAGALSQRWQVTDTLLALGGIAHAAQMDLIDTALQRMTKPAAIVTMEEIRNRPHLAVERAATLLGIATASRPDVIRHLERYSKNPGERFDQVRELEAEAELNRRHHASLARVEEWLTRQLGEA